MATSYEVWAKFDVDAELARVDAQTQREEQHRQVQEQRRAKQSVEDAVSTSAEQSAEVLAAHAAVAALKAKARAKKKQSAGIVANSASGGGGYSAAKDGLLVVPHTAASSNQTDTDKQEESVAERLQRQSELFKKKHELVKQIMENRRGGEAILAQSEEKQKSVKPDSSRERRALHSFENALKAGLELEKIVPDLILAEREQSILRGTRDVHPSGESAADGASTIETKPNDSHYHHDDPDGHVCGGDGSQCTHHSEKTQEPTKKKTNNGKDALPKMNDLDAILKMFFKDIHMGIGACHLHGNRLAAASDAFKDVLLRDDAHVAAWLERGNAFERMGANLLAMLHFSRAAALDPQDEKAKESLERVKETLLSGLDDIMGADAIKRKVESLIQVTSLPAILNSIHLIFQEANVLMIEGFFQYAISKYQIVLGCIDFLLNQRPELLNTDEESSDLTAEIQESLLQLRTSCRLNIAGGYHEMQKNQLKAVEYCDKILEGDATGPRVQVVCHYRIGQLFRSAHSYERAMSHLGLSRKLMLAAGHHVPEQSQQQQEQRIETLKKIDKEIDRCGFERSQHDLVHIRSLLELNSAGSSSSSSSTSA